MIYGFVERVIRFRGELHVYTVYVPREYHALAPLPAVLQLHGSGESGTDGLRPLIHGVPRSMLYHRERWPVLGVFPQKPSSKGLWPEQKDFLDAILTQVEQDYEIHPRKCYLTGLSQGGHGTVMLAKALRWKFAAIAPVCGWADISQASNLLDTPIWAFHGARDEVVRPASSIELIEALRQAGGNPKFTLYPDVGHNAWDHAYMDPAFSEWLLAQELP